MSNELLRFASKIVKDTAWRRPATPPYHEKRSRQDDIELPGSILALEAVQACRIRSRSQVGGQFATAFVAIVMAKGRKRSNRSSRLNDATLTAHHTIEPGVRIAI